MKTHLVHLIAVIALCRSVLAVDLPAQVSIRGSKGKDVKVVSRQRNTIALQLPEHRLGTVKVVVDDIHSIQFALPSVAQKALGLYQQGKWDGCADLLAPVIGPYMDYIDLPNNNALPLVEKYAESLRQARRYADAAEIFRRMQALPAPKSRTRASVSLAYCQAAMGRAAEARALIKDAAVTNHQDEVFGLAKVVEARIGLLETNTLAGIDAAAQGIAVLPIDSPYYAECLALSASCYEQLHRDKAAGLLGGENHEEAVYDDRRATIPPSLTNLLAVARSISHQVTNLFPDTLWSADAQRKLVELASTNQPPPVPPQEPSLADDLLEAAAPDASQEKQP
jgi:tetratricopeptide (TPR) repeat protein